MKIITGKVCEDSTSALVARVLGRDGAAITQASLSSITCKVYDLDQAKVPTLISTPTVVVADSIFDTLQTDATWSVDSVGYNFRFYLPASAVPTGNTRYEVEFHFVPVVGDPFYVPFQLTTVEIASS